MNPAHCRSLNLPLAAAGLTSRTQWIREPHRVLTSVPENSRVGGGLVAGKDRI